MTTTSEDVLVYDMLIGGEFVGSSGGESMDAVDPSTEEVIGRFPLGTVEDVDRAVAAAKAAFPAWRALAPTARGKILTQFADRLQEHERELAELDARDSGNPVLAMLDDVRGACRELRMFAGFATEIKGTAAGNGESEFAYTVREPYGVVGRIIPFNHPLKFAAGKIAAALLAGNTVVLKPGETTSLSALRMGQIVRDLFPDGVLNVVTGLGTVVGARLAEHPDVPRVAFTGSVSAGRAVMIAGAPHFKHVSAELGGKNPMIVFPDVDPKQAAAAAIKGMNFARSQGQSCQSNSRVFVHRDIREPFLDELRKGMSALRVGNALREDVDMGPVAFKAHFERIMGYIDTGKAEGAKLELGGVRVADPGYFVAPTLFTGVRNDMTIAQDEIFGPVVSVIDWDDPDEVARQANDTRFGLTANIWCNDIRQAHRMAHQIQAGWVWINGKGKRIPGLPFGGYKESGVGKESAIEEVFEFTQTKVVHVNL